ncbi:MAG: hypothetical protein WD356_04235, partial [Pseudomonadales bacterium]
GIFGAGLNISVDGVEEAIEVDGLEGDDTFYILGTREGVVTRVIGGLGNDDFIVTGDVTGRVVSVDLQGASGILTHGITSDDSEYDGDFVNGIGLNIANASQGAVVINQSDSSTEILEDSGLWDSYKVSLAIPEIDVPAGTVATITVSAAMSSSLDRLLNKRNTGDGGPHDAASVLVSTSPTGPFSQATTINFEHGVNWEDEITIYVKAAHDDALEGERKVMISHTATVTSPDTENAAVKTLDGYAIPNVEVIVTDDDKGTLIIAETDRDTVVLEGTTGEITDTFDVSLPFAPTDDVTVTLALQDPANPQVTLSTNTLTFTTGNWMNPQTVTVEAINDTDEENPGRNTIIYTLTSDDPVFALTSDQLPETAVTVLDDDTAGVIVNE